MTLLEKDTEPIFGSSEEDEVSGVASKDLHSKGLHAKSPTLKRPTLTKDLQLKRPTTQKTYTDKRPTLCNDVILITCQPLIGIKTT